MAPVQVQAQVTKSDKIRKSLDQIKKTIEPGKDGRQFAKMQIAEALKLDENDWLIHSLVTEYMVGAGLIKVVPRNRKKKTDVVERKAAPAAKKAAPAKSSPLARTENDLLESIKGSMDQAYHSLRAESLVSFFTRAISVLTSEREKVELETIDERRQEAEEKKQAAMRLLAEAEQTLTRLKNQASNNRKAKTNSNKV